MVAFQGNLADIALASVLQNLRDARKTGSLVLRKGDEERWLYLDSGIITMVSRGQGTNAPLAEILLRSTKKKRELRSFAKRKRSKAVHASLLRAKLATKEELASALRANVQEEVYDVFTWEGGTFEFSEGPPADGLFDPAFGEIRVAVEPQAVTLEAVRRADEWVRIKRVVRGDGDIFVPLRPADGVDEEWIARVGALVDGRRTVKAITTEAEMERFHVRTALAWLAEAGYIRRKTVGDRVEGRRAKRGGGGRAEDCPGRFARPRGEEQGGGGAVQARRQRLRRAGEAG